MNYERERNLIPPDDDQLEQDIWDAADEAYERRCMEQNRMDDLEELESMTNL